MEEVKPGVKTSEFWLTAVPVVLLVLKNLTGVELEQDVIVNGILGAVSAVSAIVYVWSRVKIKTEQMKLEAELKAKGK